jgi:TusA-related sulfurtransferase
MGTKHLLDAKGLKCPLPTLMVDGKLRKNEVKPGDVLEVIADCPTFENDIKSWCTRNKKVLVYIRDEAGIKRCQIQF